MHSRRHLLQGMAALLASSISSSLLAAPRSLRMAYFETYSPISFRSDNGSLRGIVVDILEEVIGKRLSVPIEHSGYPWVRAQSLVEAGEQDGLCTVATQARREYAAASGEPVLSMPIRLFTRADNPLRGKLAAVRSLDELRTLNPTVLSYIGNGWAKEKLAGMTVDWGGNFEESLRKLIAGRGDVMVENAVSMQYTLKSLPGGELVQMMPNTIDTTHFHLLISRRSGRTDLLPAFDEALRAFKREPGYKLILERYGIKL